MKKIKLTESDLERIIKKIIKEDAGMDTPGGNPEYFYDKDSLFGKEDENSEMSKEDIIQELVAIYSYSQDGATEDVNHALENLLYTLGGFKDDVNESKQSLNESGNRITQSSMEQFMNKKFGELLKRIAELERNIK